MKINRNIWTPRESVVQRRYETASHHPQVPTRAAIRPRLGNLETDMTDFHAILALALNPDNGDLELACQPYNGFSLGGEAITEPDLLILAGYSEQAAGQLRGIHKRTTEMLEHLDRKEVV